MTWLARDAERRREFGAIAQAKARALRESTGSQSVHVATTGGDTDLLRGIPVVGARGVGGAIRGTLPHASRVFRWRTGEER